MLSDETGRTTAPFDTRLSETALLGDVDGNALAAYARALGEEPDEGLLARKGLLVHGRLTNAGVLLFAREPGRHIVRSEIAVQCRTGSDETCCAVNLGDRDCTFDQPLVTALPAIEGHIRRLLPRAYDGGAASYPVDAIMEGVVNAVAHRDYDSHGDCTSIVMLRDRIEITSAGDLPAWVTLQNMRRSHYSRNPALARRLSELGWMHDLGVGIDGIYGAMGESRVSYSVSSEYGSPHLRLVLMSRKSRNVGKGGNSAVANSPDSDWQIHK